MSIAEMMIPEFDQEMATTRKVLERIKDEAWNYKPHDKSMSFGELAMHMAQVPGYVPATIGAPEFDFAPNGVPVELPKADNVAGLIDIFDAGVTEGRKALASASDETMLANWTLKSNGQEILTMPRVAVIRAFVLSHLVHHRGQMSVYLRMNDIPVPSIYGGSADERDMPSN